MTAGTSVPEPGSLPVEQTLAQELSVKPYQVWAAIRLMDAGATVPFIARYRKEATGGLSDTHLRLLSERLEYLRALELSRRTISDSISDQGKMTPALADALKNASTKTELEDLYLPFKPNKNSKSEAACAAGLEPLADKILAGGDAESEAAAFVDELKGVLTVQHALDGARDILTQRISENAALVGMLREKFWNEGWLYSKLSRLKASDSEAQNFRDYFDFREAFVKIPSHRILAILRGRSTGFLSTRLETTGLVGFNDKAADETEYVESVLKEFRVRSYGKSCGRWLMETVKYAWKYRLRISLETDMNVRLRQKAEEEALRVFAENLKELLLAAPAGGRTVLGLDPGIRTGVKLACIDGTGKVLECGVIHPFEPRMDRAGSLRTLKELISKHSVELVAIGNGTASRETDQLVAELLKDPSLAKTQKAVVSEAGASVYSASELASKELPSLDVTLRGAVSIARRLQDPLAELVKIDPKAIGVGQYQHDVNQFRLEKRLRAVVEDCVNAVGVEVNTASASLLAYVSGLNRTITENLVAYRDSNGPFRTREQLKKVAGFGDRTFEQAAGFLRIRNGDAPLDRSGVHPEAYAVVEKILDRQSIGLEDLIGNHALIQQLDPSDFADDKFGVMTVEDILAELDKPGLDPRPEFKTVSFDAGVTDIAHVTPGLILDGVITNVANFGAFVDIGVHLDGLVHVSQLSSEFVQDPRSVVKPGQIVRVKVLEVDRSRSRISLSMRLKERVKS